LDTKTLVALGWSVVSNPVGVAKEENEGMEMDFAARAEEKRDSTEEMMREMCFSFVERVPLVAKEGLGVGVEEDSVDELEVEDEEEEVVEGSIDELDEVVEDSVNESVEEDETDEEKAEELVVETKELETSVEEEVKDVEDEEELL
jgi:hypothetical protein